MKSYPTMGVCSRQIDFQIRDNILTKVRFIGGCSGNLQAISTLVEGMPVDEVIKKLKGIDCNGRETSCADQLVLALEKELGL